MSAQINIQVGAQVNNAIAGLQQVQSQAQSTFNAVSQSSNQARTAVGNLSRIVQDAPFGFIAISNNLQPLFDDFTRLRSQTGSVGGALRALGGSIIGPAGIGLAFSAATALITVFSKELFGSGKAAEKAKTEADKLKDSINGIFSQTAKEAASAASLVAVLRSETESRERKLSAIKQLQQIQPEIFAGLKLEGETVIGLDSAYQKYIANLQTVIAAKVKQAQLEQAIEKLLKLQGATLTADEKRYKDFGKAIGDAYKKQISGSVASVQFSERSRKQTEKETNQIKLLQAEIQDLTDDLSELSSGVKLPDLPAPKIKKDKFDLKKIFELEFASLEIDFGEIVDTPQAIRDGAILGQAFTKGVDEALKTGGEVRPENIAFRKFVKDYEDAAARVQATNKLIADQLGGIVQSAFSGLFTALKNGENAFKSFAQSVGNALLSVVERIVATAATAAILSFIFPGGVSGAKGFQQIFGSLIGLRANGGPVTGRSPYIVGERGPELFVPSVSGNVIPNNRLSSFNGRPAFSGGVGGRSIVRGNDILLSYARTQRSQSRVNG